MFSLLCMLIVTTCLYFMTLQFFDRKSALIAALLFSCEGSVLFLGRLATYDAFCLCLLSLAIVFSLRASQAASAQSLLMVGLLLVLAVAAKYAGLLFVPTVLALLAWWSWKHKGLEEMFVRLGIALFSLMAAGFMAFLIMDKQVLTGLSFTTTNRVSFVQTGPIQVIQHIVMMEGIFFGLGFLGLLLCGRQRLPTGLLLFSSALLVPLFHAYKAAIQEGYFDLIELSYGYHTPLAIQIYQNLAASKQYELVARISIHNSYGSGYYWVWSKRASTSNSVENSV